MRTQKSLWSKETESLKSCRLSWKLIGMTDSNSFIVYSMKVDGSAKEIAVSWERLFEHSSTRKKIRKLLNSFELDTTVDKSLWKFKRIRAHWAQKRTNESTWEFAAKWEGEFGLSSFIYCNTYLSRFNCLGTHESWLERTWESRGKDLMPIPRNKKEIQNVVLNRVINDSVSYYYYF